MRRRKSYDPGTRSDDVRIRSALASYIRQGGLGQPTADVVTYRSLRYIRLWSDQRLACTFRVLNSGQLRRMKRPPAALRWRNPDLGPPLDTRQVIAAIQAIKKLAARARVPWHVAAALGLAEVSVDDGEVVATFPRAMQDCADDVVRYADAMSEAVGMSLVVRVAEDAEDTFRGPERLRSPLSSAPTLRNTIQSPARPAYEVVSTADGGFNVRGPDGRLLFTVALTQEAATRLAERLNARDRSSLTRSIEPSVL